MNVTFVVLAAVAISAIVYVLREPGPNAWVVLIQRYSIWPFVFVALTLAVVVGHFAWPVQTRIALLLAAWIVVCVGVAQRWNRGTPRRALRRCVLRARWPSVARASNLATTGDRRSPDWPGGVIVTLNSNRIEHLATISHGRARNDRTGVVYRLRPARGSDIPTVRALAEPIAAGLKVDRVLVERDKPAYGHLTVMWDSSIVDLQDAQP